jgi:hypothetical protein
LPIVRISPEWVMSLEQVKYNGRIATFNLWTGMFWDVISNIPDETVILLTWPSLPRVWERYTTECPVIDYREYKKTIHQQAEETRGDRKRDF